MEKYEGGLGGIFCDFDGTITPFDAMDAILEKFALPSWERWEARWKAGEITARECMARQVELIYADRKTLTEFARNIPVDPGIFELDRECRSRGVAFTILSDGLDFVIDTVLKRHGLGHIPFFANHVTWTPERTARLDFPHYHPDCRAKAGACKCALARGRGGFAGRIYIGDGRSDFCVSTQADVVYAKNELRAWCREQNLPHRPFTDLRGVAEELFSTQEALIS